MFVVPLANQLSYRSIARNGDLKLAIANRCNAPSRTLLVDWKGDCFVCSCEAWLPVTAGHIMGVASLQEFWSTGTAPALQQDIDQGLFTHCAVDRCGILDKNIQQEPYLISINIDDSCNLRCPSCRRDTIMLSSGADYEERLAWVNHLVDLIEQFEEPVHIVMSGNGDPLASAILRPLLHRFRPKKNQTIRLFTNGLLLRKQLSNNPIVDNITQYFISTDAGSQEVYERVRLGGQFAQLIANLDYLQTVINRRGAEVLLKFVLQQDNWHDQENFVKLALDRGFNCVINRLEDWGTWDEFTALDVIGNAQHPDHLLALQELRRVYSLYSDRVQFNPSLVQLAKGTVAAS
jgi:molybdenum cofactor biosynthesis enzyme MoaA